MNIIVIGIYGLPHIDGSFSGVVYIFSSGISNINLTESMCPRQVSGSITEVDGLFSLPGVFTISPIFTGSFHSEFGLSLEDTQIFHPPIPLVLSEVKYRYRPSPVIGGTHSLNLVLTLLPIFIGRDGVNPFCFFGTKPESFRYSLELP